MGRKQLIKSKSDPRTRQHSRQISSRTKSENQIDIPAKVNNFGENLSFGGCGFLALYHVGVASCFHEYAPQVSTDKIAGSSAGAIVAAAHICGNIELVNATSGILRIAIDARARTLGPLHPTFDVTAIIRDALEHGLPDDVHIRASDKLHISLTRVYDGRNVVVSKFDSKEDVIQALICSCFIPFWSGFVAPKFKGVTYIDGGFSNNLLILDDKTVTVSPFAGETDICPQDDVCSLLSFSLANTSMSVTPHNLYRLSLAFLPPPPEVLSELCKRGFADGIRYLQQMKLISCTRCLEIGSTSFVETEIIEQIFSYRDERRDSTSSFDEQIFMDSSSSFEENEFTEDGNCDGCTLRRNNATSDLMPTQFTDRIREACENVNKSLSKWLYFHRSIKYLSYLAAPCYLPLDISLRLLMKYSQLIHLIGIEFIKGALDLKDLLIELAKKLHEQSTNSLLMSPSFVWYAEENTLSKQQQKTTGGSPISVKFTTDCRQSLVQSITTYECCLTFALCGRDISNITNL